MPYIYNNLIKYINDQPGNPTLTIQGSADTIDGYTASTSERRPIVFTPISTSDTIDGYTASTSERRPLNIQP